LWLIIDQILFTFDLQHAQLFLYEFLDVYAVHTCLHVSSRSTGVLYDALPQQHRSITHQDLKTRAASIHNKKDIRNEKQFTGAACKKYVEQEEEDMSRNNVEQ
jgi:hypothetical protein